MVSVRPGYWLGLGAVLVFAIFSPGLSNGFVNWDDGRLILENLHFRGLGPRTLGWMFTSFYMTTYQPLGWLAYDAIYLVQGLNPFGFHAASIALHCLNFLLLASAVARLLPDRSRFAIFSAALLWAVHPLQVESVAWATEIPDLLSTTFFLASFLAYLQRRLTISCLLFLACGLARWKGVVLPLALLCADYFPLRRLSDRRTWLEKIPFFAIAAIVILLNHAAKAEVQAFSPLSLPASLCRALCFYGQKIAIPFNLHPFYLLSGHTAAASWPLPACIASVLGLTAVFLWLARRQPSILLAWIFFAAAIAPTLARSNEGLVFAQDHYVYLAGLGIVPVAAAIMARGRVWLLSGLACSLVWAGLSCRQVGIWRDSVTLWSAALARDPGSPIARGNLGTGLIEAGRYVEATNAIREQLALNPANALDRHNLDVARSRDAWRQKSPAQFYGNLAVEAFAQGRAPEAGFLLAKSLQLAPKLALTHENLAVALNAEGRTEEAGRHLEMAARLRADPRGRAPARETIRTPSRALSDDRR
jgi:tetratricopeptide (TPR) repeat protein